MLLIDLDPQAHATLGLNIKSDLSIYNVLSKLTQKKSSLEDIIQEVDSDFDIAPSGMILSTIEQELAGEIGREARLRDILNNFKGEYEYIIIDCPPNLGILTINAIRSSNEIIIPVEASRFSLEGIAQLTSIIELVRDRLSHDVESKVLVTNFDSRLRHSFTMLAKIKADFSAKLFDTIVHVNVKLKEAQNHGQHIFKFDKYCRGAKDYYSLSREIISRDTKPSGVAIDLREKMRELVRENLPRLISIDFAVTAPSAKEVFLAGEFNEWKVNETSRMSFNNGVWVKKVSLPLGKYRYRFVVDGKWVEDTSNPLKELNPYGEMDSLVEVSSKK